ncbi:MAG: porin [Planctomycetes bacterium]|nr:porin [Planctomycetota bacterium]
MYAGWTLTGESRPWAKGVLDKVKPERNFPDDGPGAVEIGVRWSWLDLSDGSFEGGDVDDFTLGVNWWLNPLTRVMVNWVHSRLRHAGEADSLSIRFQLDF